MISGHNKNLVIFLSKALCFAIFWIILSHFDLLNKWNINSSLINSLVVQSQNIMEFIGYEIFTSGNKVGIQGGSKVIIGAPCNALDLMYLFSALILLMPGKRINKVAYIIVGLSIIHFLNIIRVCMLLYLANFYPDSLEFNHNYTFTLIIYIVIFSLWLLWNKKISNLSLRK